MSLRGVLSRAGEALTAAVIIRKCVRSTAGACALLCLTFTTAVGVAQGADDPVPAKPSIEQNAARTMQSLAAGKAAQTGVLGAQSSLNTGTDPLDLETLMIVAALSVAAACFGLAAVPATLVPWGPAARLVVLGRLPVLFIGCGVFLATVILARSAW
jgi:hypothetical protein